MKRSLGNVTVLILKVTKSGSISDSDNQTRGRSVSKLYSKYPVLTVGFPGGDPVSGYTISDSELRHIFEWS